MKNIRTLIFSGAGINATSMKKALLQASEPPSRKMFSLGATWPFVQLVISEADATFKMPGVQKSVSPKDTTVYLDKFGYFFFRTKNDLNDFGFSALRFNVLLTALKRTGFKLDDSCEANLKFARLWASAYILLALVTAITAISSILLIS